MRTIEDIYKLFLGVGKGKSKGQKSKGQKSKGQKENVKKQN